MSNMAFGSLEFWLIASLALILLAKMMQYVLGVWRARSSGSSGPILIEDWFHDENRGRGDRERAGDRSPEPMPDPSSGGGLSDQASAWGLISSAAPPPGRGNGISTSADPEPSRSPRERDPAQRDPRQPASGIPPHAVLAELPEGDWTPCDETSETVRIDLGATGTVQLLPGRLEVLRGGEIGREYRFLRAPGQRVPEITIGRSSGSANRHIQIPQATVSRLHARLRYEDGCWQIANLSSINPTRVNGEELGPMHESKPLCDGDRIELGEVEVLFRENAR